MRKFFPALLIALVLTSCTNIGSRYSINSDFYRNQVVSNTVLRQYAYTPRIKAILSRTPVLLQPKDTDFLTASTDLNGDGHEDIIGTITHYHFEKDGKYPLYIFIKNKYSYDQLPLAIYVRTLDLKVLDSKTNGYRDISIAGKIYRFDGKNYKREEM